MKNKTPFILLLVVITILLIAGCTAPTTPTSTTTVTTCVQPTQAPAQPLSGNPCINCGCPYVLDDASYKNDTLFTNIRGYRYMELFITCPNVASGKPNTGIYNTMGFNVLPDNSKDSAPARLMANYSDAAAAADYGATQVWMSGVRHWVIDDFRVYTNRNNVRNFAGLDTMMGASMTTPPGYDLSSESSSYTVNYVNRQSTFYFDKGQPIFILDAPDGTPYIQQSYTNLVDPNLSYDDLFNLKLDLPAGWSRRTVNITQDLQMTGINGSEWHVIQDNLKNSYSGCYKSGNQAVCNFQP